ncbi:MAG: GAF domain-containing protein [Acidobacteria bacterium]|jgi:transcriptional regulator with GAF, ATPase, and Fis domain|nr:MAG: GAF domain-containing protein [Acidobacteriota bacterium]GIU81456.1 MAG: Fis family transcriptional regulator [Pyrinomonadaceae bacterium]
MKIELEIPQSLSLERKVKMHEAREAIIERLARDLPQSIDLERFLNVVVSEIGKMMDVDRCDLIQLSETGNLRISHEWRKDDKVPQSEGTIIPIQAKDLAGKFDFTKPFCIKNILEIKNPLVTLFARNLGTKSLLVVPISLSGKVIGLLGLHTTEDFRDWLDEEINFLESIARHLAIGYQYTRLYVALQREAERTNALLEIANILNSHSDFDEVSSKVLERAVELVGASYGALGVLDKSGSKISLASFKSAPNSEPNEVLKMIEQYNKSIELEPFPILREILKEGKTLKLFDRDLPLGIRVIFTSKLIGRAALVTPVRVGGQTFGLLGFVWSDEKEEFENHEVALVEGIADQIGTALERDRLSAEVMRLKSELQEMYSPQIIGNSSAIRNAIKLALKVASTRTTVLIQGESGTGKELLADLIHYNSGREDKPYVKINCGAIPEGLIESELFGHEKGAFTDAKTRRIGKFEEANGGTLFLDEIAELPMTAQVKLLRVLQDGEFTRIGGNEVIKTDVRVIAATNVNLERAVEEGKFRGDLFYRLSVFPINLPPLRERREDIPLLVFHFLKKYQRKTGRFISGISKAAMQALLSYEWHGNVRELENAIERAVIIAAGVNIELEDLPEAIIKKAPKTNGEEVLRLMDIDETSPVLANSKQSLVIDFPATIEEIEKRAIEAALEYTQGDKSRASRLLKIGRKTLYRKLREYGIGK